MKNLNSIQAIEGHCNLFDGYESLTLLHDNFIHYVNFDDYPLNNETQTALRYLKSLANVLSKFDNLRPNSPADVYQNLHDEITNVVNTDTDFLKILMSFHNQFVHEFNVELYGKDEQKSLYFLALVVEEIGKMAFNKEQVIHAN